MNHMVTPQCTYNAGSFVFCLFYKTKAILWYFSNLKKLCSIEIKIKPSFCDFMVNGQKRTLMVIPVSSFSSSSTVLILSDLDFFFFFLQYNKKYIKDSSKDSIEVHTVPNLRFLSKKSTLGKTCIEDNFSNSIRRKISNLLIVKNA